MPPMPPSSTAFAAGDATIKHWSGGRCVKTFKGHTDTVRYEVSPFVLLLLCLHFHPDLVEGRVLGWCCAVLIAQARCEGCWRTMEES